MPGYGTTVMQGATFNATFNAGMRRRAWAVIQNMGAGCQQALGQLFNLNDFANKTDDTDFYDANDWGNVSMSYFGYTQAPDNSNEAVGHLTVKAFMERYGVRAFVDLTHDGKMGKRIVLPSNLPSLALVHEMLHRYTGLGDIPLAARLGAANSHDISEWDTVKAATWVMGQVEFLDCSGIQRPR